MQKDDSSDGKSLHRLYTPHILLVYHYLCYEVGMLEITATRRTATATGTEAIEIRIGSFRHFKPGDKYCTYAFYSKHQTYFICIKYGTKIYR